MVPPFTFLLLLLLLLLPHRLGAAEHHDFLFNGFHGANLDLDGTAEITSDGLVILTGAGRVQQGHAFYPPPLPFKASPAGDAFSFSCTFVFCIIPERPGLGGHGIAFEVSPAGHSFDDGISSRYFGIPSWWTDGSRSTDRLLVVELDTHQDSDVEDMDANHVGFDINSMKSVSSSPAGYYAHGAGEFKNLTLTSGDPMQVWVDYDGKEAKLDVTLSPLGVAKPSTPLLSSAINLSEIIKPEMYVGFSAASGSFSARHYILGWSFKVNGEAPPLDISRLPSPLQGSGRRSRLALALLLSLVAVMLVLLIVAAGVFLVMRMIKYSELIEDWESDFGSHRFPYRHLYAATGGFKEKGLLGRGGFGMVYKGVLPTSKAEVAVKRISHESKQGMKEFIAEIVSLGRLRHRNLVQLLGYCRRKGELLLVYDYMPNGSLDKLLFDRTRPGLDWKKRFQIVKGVASGLLYLHEEWEKVVIHRDVKASNVLLDGELNGRLSDFGLARLYDHGNDPQTTRVAGTVGYLAPELARTGKATKPTDVFAFGVFLLEVACGRRPIEHQAPAPDEVVLLDWVLRSWRRGEAAGCADPRLGGEYAAGEMELVLKLGLLCAHPLQATRPTMRQVTQYLNGETPLPELPLIHEDVLQDETFDCCGVLSAPRFSTDSLLCGGR